MEVFLLLLIGGSHLGKTLIGNFAIKVMLRDTLLQIAKDELGWDAIALAGTQIGRPVVDILTSVAKKDFSKYKLAKAFLRWSRDHGLADLQPHEIEQASNLVAKINKSFL